MRKKIWGFIIPFMFLGGISESDWDTAEDRLRKLRQSLAQNTRSTTAAERVANEVATIIVN